MKRSIAIALICCLVLSALSLFGCGKADDANETTDPVAESETSGDEPTGVTLPGNNEAEVEEPKTLTEEECPVITLTPEKTEVSAGDTLDAVLHIDNARLLASLTVSVGFDSEKLACEDFETHSVTGFYDISNKLEGQMIYSGYVLTTTNIVDEDVAILHLKVADGVESGEKLTLSIDVPEFKLGTDESGDTIYDVAAQVKAENVEITVK